MKATALSLVVTSALVPLGMSQAAAVDTKCGALVCSGTGGGGAYTGYDEQETRALERSDKAPVMVANKKVIKQVPYEYMTLLACGNNFPTKGRELGCTSAYQICTDANAEGPYTRIYRRFTEIAPGTPNPWRSVGTTCWPNAVPNSNNRPRLTMAMIKSQWEHTPFAKPTASTQPVGGRTLVTLPAYFQLHYPAAGFQPNEINTVTLLGHQVRIRPTFKHNVFTYGDGTTSGPTQSAGGVYPDGDIKHAYTKAGHYVTSVATTYGGQYSVDGGAWADIPGTITVAGPSSAIEVVTTKNELVNE